MHILIKALNGNFIVRKKTDIRAIYSTAEGITVICFNGVKNTPIKVAETVEDFFNLYLAK